MQVAAPLTIDDLSDLPPNEGSWELIDGEVVMMSPSNPQHGDIAGELIALLRVHFRGRRKQWCAVGDSVGFLIKRHPDNLLCPDVAVYQPQRERDSSKPWVPFCPQVAMEIISPSQTLADALRKKQAYLEGGAEQVWIINPRDQTIAIYNADGSRLGYHNEVLSGFGCLQGFSLDVGDLFVGSPYWDED